MMTEIIPAAGPADLVQLQLRHYLENALSDNTRRAYRADLDHYKHWRGGIPAQPETIARYLTAHAETLSIATLQRRLIGIRAAHRVLGYPDPTSAEIVRLTLRGIQRLHGKPQTQVSPLLRDDLLLMLSHAPDNLKGHRDRALLLLGFCAALRRSELVAVRVEDLEFITQGLSLTLPRSKTDQAGQGRKIAIPAGTGKVCPVASVGFWRNKSGIENGFVFRAVTKGGSLSDAPLSDRAVADIVKSYAAKAGLNPDNYSGHSLRAGLATSAAQAGFSSWSIRRQTGHRSDAMLNRYIREGSLFRDNAAAMF